MAWPFPLLSLVPRPDRMTHGVGLRTQRIELAVQHAETVRALKIQPARTVLARIGELHVVKSIEELGRERKPNLFCNLGGLGEGEVQVPTMLAVKRTEIVGTTVDTQYHRPKHVIHGLWIGKQVHLA